MFVYQVVSPTISSPVCQEQLIEAGKLVDRSVEGCVKACLSATSDGELLKAVSAAAGIVTQALSDLLTHVRNYATRGEPIRRYDQATDTIMTVTESIFCSMGDAGKMSASFTLPFNSLEWIRLFFMICKISYTHQDCIYLIKIQ